MIYNILLAFLSSFLPTMSHDIHLSVTEITKEEDKIEVVIKIFYDDLQAAMGLVPGEELPDAYSGAEELIQEYISKNFVLTLNDQVLNLELSESVALLPAIWSTFTIGNFNWSDDMNSLEIKNQLMLNLFDDQKNIVKVNLGEKQKDITFTKSKYIETILF